MNQDPDLDVDYMVEEIDKKLPEFNELMKDIVAITREAWKYQSLEQMATYADAEQKIGLFQYEDLDYYPEILHISGDNDNGPKFNDKKQLMDIITDFNTVNFFDSKETRTNFIFLINYAFSIMTEEIHNAIKRELGSDVDIDIMFKGGTTMRILVKELVRNFTAQVENYVNELIRNAVKLSDYDFEIISISGLPDPLIVKINVISYLCLLRIRNYLEKYKELYFDFFTLKQSIQQQRIAALKNKLQRAVNSTDQSSYFYGASIDYVEFAGSCTTDANKVFDRALNQDLSKYHYITESDTKAAHSTCRADFVLIADYNHVKSNIGVASAYNILSKHYGLSSHLSSLANASRMDGSRFYATHNPHIGWKVAADGTKKSTVSFALNRIKYNYTVYFTKPNGEKLMLDIPGEVLDLSHSHNCDRKKVKYDRPIAQLDFLQRFHFMNNNLTYLSYSLKGHIVDIGSIIFMETGHMPWVDTKYAKRIQRIIIIATLLYFNQRSDSYSNKLAKLRGIVNAVQHTDGKQGFTTGNQIMDTLVQDIVLCISTGKDHGDARVEPFRDTCVNILRQMFYAFQAQHYYTRDQVFSYTDSRRNNVTGLTDIPLQLDYRNIY